MVELTDVKNNTVYVNANNVESLSPVAENETMIKFVSGAVMYVKHPADHVNNVIYATNQAAVDNYFYSQQQYPR